MSRGWITEPRDAQHRPTIRSQGSRPRVAPLTENAEPNGVRAFAQQVALATAGPCLRYSQRLHLFALANEAGITRFDANLIIAAIEHRAGKNRATVEPATATWSLARPSMLLSAAAALQVAILFAGWTMLMR